MKLTTSQFQPLHEIYIQHTFISHPHTQLTHTHPLPKTLIFTFHLTFDIVPHFPLPIAPHSTYQTRVHCCANLGFDMCTVQPHNVPISTVARILHSKCSSFAPTYTVHPLPKTLMFTFHFTLCTISPPHCPSFNISHILQQEIRMQETYQHSEIVTNWVRFASSVTLCSSTQLRCPLRVSPSFLQPHFLLSSTSLSSTSPSLAPQPSLFGSLEATVLRSLQATVLRSSTSSMFKISSQLPLFFAEGQFCPNIFSLSPMLPRVTPCQSPFHHKITPNCKCNTKNENTNYYNTCW